MAESSTVVSGEDATPDQYNDLRKDVRDPALGHDHEGTEGKILDGGVALAAGTITEDRLITALADKINNAMPRLTAKKTTFVTNASTGLETMLNITAKSGRLISLIIEPGSNTAVRLRVTLDGVLVADTNINTNAIFQMGPDGIGFIPSTTLVAGDFKNPAAAQNGSGYIGWDFKTTMLIEVDGGSGTKTVRAIHAEE